MCRGLGPFVATWALAATLSAKMAKQFDASGFFGEWPVSLRPAPGIVTGAASQAYRMDDDHHAAMAELFEEWDQKPRGPGSLTCAEDDPAVEMLEMGLLEAD